MYYHSERDLFVFSPDIYYIIRNHATNHTAQSIVNHIVPFK